MELVIYRHNLTIQIILESRVECTNSLFFRLNSTMDILRLLVVTRKILLQNNIFLRNLRCQSLSSSENQLAYFFCSFLAGNKICRHLSRLTDSSHVFATLFCTHSYAMPLWSIMKLLTGYCKGDQQG